MIARLCEWSEAVDFNLRLIATLGPSFEALRASQIASRGQTLRGHDVFVGARPMNAKLRKIAAVDRGQKGDAEGPILVAKRKFADLRVSIRC